MTFSLECETTKVSQRAFPAGRSLHLAEGIPRLSGIRSNEV